MFETHWVVKRYFTGGSSIVSRRYEHSHEAQAHALRLNQEYQTDEHIVERWFLND